MFRTLIWLWPRLPLGRKARSIIIWLFSPKYLVGVAAVIFDGDGHILLLKHTYRGKYPWGLPGGGLKPGETLEECIVREVREETGLRVEAVRLLSSATHPGRRLLDVIFLCRTLGGRDLSRFQPNAEIIQAAYFSLDNLPPGIPRFQVRLITSALETLAPGIQKI